MNKTTKINKFLEVIKRREIKSLGLIIIFIIAVLASMSVSPQVYRSNIHEGDIALKDVYAPYDFTYNWGTDEEATDKAREAASGSILPMVSRDLGSQVNVITGLEDFFTVLKEQSGSEDPVYLKIAELEKVAADDITDKNLNALIRYDDADQLSKKTINIINMVFEQGFIDQESLDTLKEEKADEIIIFSAETGKGPTRQVSTLLNRRKTGDFIKKYVSESFDDRKIRQPVNALISVFISPNLKLDMEMTESERVKAEGVTGVIYREWDVKRNEIIIQKGKRVNERHIAQISQLRSFFRPGRSPKFFWGVLLLFILLGLVAAVHTVYTRKKGMLKNTREVGLILLNMFFIIVAADFIMRSPQPSYLIPMASVGMMITFLVGFNVAFVSVVLMSTFISVLVGGNIEMSMAMMVASLVGMFAIRGSRRRSGILFAGLFAGIAKFLAIICIGLINGMDMNFFLRDGLWGLSSGILSGFIVMGALPVFEYFFKIHTNISLLELSDLNHPLLKRMAMEAPGTYHHSIMVGNLAESACEAIEANSLLARVGAYYHDIGKISKAEYFSENEMGAKSKHSKLSPQMSSLIISKHVKEGVELAKKHKLNDAIINFITQHHGNSVIAYFYQRAMEAAGEDEEVDAANYRYPGPRPQSKETAVVLLADSVEASSRSLVDPTPSSINNLVKKLMNNKFIDGQFDECDLTLKDLHKIAESFVRVLMGVFHTRLSYPSDTMGKRSNGRSFKNGASSPKAGRTGNGDKDKQRKHKRKDQN